MKKFVLIDGNSLINRAFYALPPLTGNNGTPTQGVYGFTTMLIKAISEIKPDYLAVAFDLPQPTFRHLKYTEYKAQRKKMPQELAVQLPVLKELLNKMGVAVVEKAGFEADDIIGTMAKKAENVHTYIITGDRDSLQLIDENITVMLTKKGLSEVHSLNREELYKEFMLTPAQVIDYKALCGDASDNIPGVAGIGDKTATTLINTYKSLSGVYEHLSEITGKLNEKLNEGKETAYLSQYLATIDTNVELEISEKDCRYNFPFSGAVKLFFQELNFKSLVKKDELFSLDQGQEYIGASNKKPLTSVKVISDIDQLKAILGGVKEGRIALDFGNSINFAVNSGTEYAVNISYSLIDSGLDYNDTVKAFIPVLENEAVLKVLFDYKVFKKLPEVNKIDIRNYTDVKLMQYLVDMSVKYDTLGELLTTYDADEHEPATGLLFISSVLATEIEKLDMHKLYYDVELPLTKILSEMEKRGFRVDLAKLTELGNEFYKKQEVLTDQIYKLAGVEFNINSPKQLSKVLFEDMKIPYPNKSKNISTSADILEQLEEEYPVARLILNYRFYAKLNSTYVEGLKKVADMAGFVRTEFKQTLTSTGRLSSVEPNLQNIPVRQDEGRMLRAAFIAKEGNVLVSADYSQIELRLMAHFSRDKIMTQAYLNNEDIHASTAAEVFGVNKNEVTAAMRRDAKAVNFGIIYGISDFGLAKNLNIAPYKAKQYISKYFERFSGIKAYLEKSVALAKEKGYAVTLLNRVRKIPELYSSNYNIRQFGERVAMNMPLQGSAADIIKIAMIGVERALEGMKSKLILQVHDELIIDAAMDEVDEVKRILKDEMENAVTLNVPLTVDIGCGKTWFDCK